jgi:hypothetical protein
MNPSLLLPDWVPWWVPLVLLLPAALYGLAFLFMPFSVIGVKSRLEVIEARLDEIQNEIRHLALRLPAGSAELDFEETYTPVTRATRRPAPEPMPVRPPIPPAPQDLYDEDDIPEDRPPPPPHMQPVRRAEPRDSQPMRPERTEPRFDRRR